MSLVIFRPRINPRFFKNKIRQNLFLPPTNKFIIKKLAKKIGVPDQIINQRKVGTEFNLNSSTLFFFLAFANLYKSFLVTCVIIMVIFIHRS